MASVVMSQSTISIATGSAGMPIELNIESKEIV